ncbi:MAG: hypothetical protein ABR986_11705, partial [Methanomassiliicoccales archaeon]
MTDWRYDALGIMDRHSVMAKCGAAARRLMGERCIGAEYGFTAVDNQIHEVIVGKNATIFAERSLFPLIESHMARFNR